MSLRTLCPSSLIAAVLVLAALQQDPDLVAPAASTSEAAWVDEEICPEDQAPAAIDPRLVGMWHRYEAAADGDPIRFYFFHPDGFGIYRYGRVGLTNTHSFDYSSAGGSLELKFRKTGVTDAPRYSIEEDADGTWLVLRGDPREAGDVVRYRRAPDMSAACDSGPIALRGGPGAFGGSLGGRLWGEEQRYATGGMGFAMYQLQPQAIDGRGVGWYHRGDYDEWQTESLTYRQQGTNITLGFTLRHEWSHTLVALGELPDGTRTLSLQEDPRDYWRPHTYRDLGPSFAACP